jgi:transcriptional regulator with XRE-family HTH domain
MGKVPGDLRKNIAANIRDCRSKQYPRWGGSKLCAQDFGVSPQQWSQWERGTHMPDEFRMIEIARFFDVSTEYLRRDNTCIPPVERSPALQFGAVRIDNGVEVPLRVEIERVVYLNNFQVRMERLL